MARGTEDWIADGCREIRAAVERGDGETAADLAAYVEAHGTGRVIREALAARRRKRIRRFLKFGSKLCQVDGCGFPTMPEPWARWCWACAPGVARIAREGNTWKP